MMFEMMLLHREVNFEKCDVVFDFAPSLNAFFECENISTQKFKSYRVCEDCLRKIKIMQVNNCLDR